MLVHPRNPLNIGAVARAMSNFGFFDLRLVAPYDEAWREARSAVGAAKVLDGARVFETTAEAAADATLVIGTASLGHRELKLTVRRLEPGARLIRRHTGRVALLLGSEKYGLSNDDLSLCHWLMRIPTRDEHESMNLGQAAALCLYELIRDPRAARKQTKPREAADGATLSRLEALLTEILAESGYTQGLTAASSEMKLRRLLRRMDLDVRDAEVWLGMLRQIRWRIAGSRPS